MDGSKVCLILVFLCLFGRCFASLISESGSTAIFHEATRNFLLSFKDTQQTFNFNLDSDIPLRDSVSSTRRNNKKKKRGSRGGVLQRLKRRGSRFPLPTISLTNIQSLWNKHDELSALLQYDNHFRRCNVLCLTETWLHEGKNVNFPGRTVIRADRDNTAAGKQGCGGGVCMIVDDSWGTQYTIREKVCTKDYEILTVSFRPFYLPREFGQITLILAYLPGPNFEACGERLAESYHAAIARSADQPVFILGDFNKCELSTHIPGLDQYVNIPTTKKNTTLDKCYGSIQHAYASIGRPAIGLSYHNVVHLLPKYRQKVKTHKPKEITRQIWNEETVNELQACFEATDWNIFTDNVSDPSELVDTISSYIKFCENSIVKTKVSKVFANNKPWVTKELKSYIVQKNYAFISGDQDMKNQTTKELSRQCVIAKHKYKEKVQKKFTEGKAREAWEGLKVMMGTSSQQSKQSLPQSAASVDELNEFYARFDIRDLKPECEAFCESLEPEPLEIMECDVLRSFKRLNPRKAPGPDGIKSKLLKNCASQLCKIFTYVFQFLMNAHSMPRAWKTSTIIPIPKNSKASQPNDFRPVALTSVLAKCFESILCKFLKSQVAEKLDPFQFSYRAKRGTDDACLTLLNYLSKHLSGNHTYARILMIDFSSAFNSIEPFVLLKRLSDLNVNKSLILFIYDFLSDRPQRVFASGIFSKELILNTGVPQGCVLSPTLFSLYTNEMQMNDIYTKLFKFADDMALVGLLSDQALTLSNYYQKVENLSDWCKESFLELNVKKTKELVFENNCDVEIEPLKIGGEHVERVKNFKYLGTIIDDRLKFSENVYLIFRKSQQRMYLLRKLKSFHVSSAILETAYRSLIESVLGYNISCWYGFVDAKDRKKLDRIVHLAEKIIGRRQNSMKDLYVQSVSRKCKRILSCDSNPLIQEFNLLPSGRRYRVPLAKKSYRKSFIPSAISILNGQKIM